MTLSTTSYHPSTGRKGRIFFEPEELDSGRFTGRLEMELPEETGEPVRFSIDEVQDMHVAPYEVSVSPEEDGHRVSIRIAGSSPRVTFSPDQPDTDEQALVYRFDFPDLTTVEFCVRFLEEGLTESLISDIQERYDADRSPFHDFTQDAKFGLPYPQYVELLASSAAVDEVVRSDLQYDRHRFMKNLIRGRRVGSQFPIRNHSEFESRIAEFGRYEELEPLDRSQIIMELIKDASNHETHLDDICHLEQTFVEVADELGTGFFVNLVSEALLTNFSVSTVTTTFENGFQVDARDLVRRRYNHWEVSDPYEDLQEHAYDTRDLEDWQRALAAVDDPESSQFDHALADLLYWYTETTGAIPDGIKPRVYATAETLYRETDNTYMADAAEYRACLTEGVHQQENESFENARVEFFRANSISSERAGPPFDEVKTFLESVLTDIAEHREQGEFMEAYEKAEYGYSELVEGAYQDGDTEDEEILLDGWKHDMQAQHQRANGQFEEAIKTTNEAIADFRHVGADGLAQTAQTRRYQIQAIMAQLEPDFDKAANHHRNAQEESTSGKTAHLHAVETDLCLVKNHLLEGEISEARERLDECDSSEPAVNNLGVLIDVYDDYRQGGITPTDAVIDRLDTSRSAESRVGRHIAYHGDYVSAVILVATSQRLKQQNVSASILDHITRVAIKNAISGGMPREWAEVTELSQIDAENIWRQLIPSVILKDIEYVEILARQPHPNYAAQGMKLLAALEGYLRVLVEYYAKQEYGASWRQEVVSDRGISLGDIYTFFESDDAAERIGAAEDIYAELEEVRYFGADSRILDVRNDLDHNDLNWLDESSFEELKTRVFQIMRWSAADCPVIAQIDDVDEKHQIYFGSARLQRHRLPRRIEINTRAELQKDESLYLPPQLEVESGIAQVDPDSIEQCELQPKQITEERS